MYCKEGTQHVLARLQLFLQGFYVLQLHLRHIWFLLCNVLRRGSFKSHGVQDIWACILHKASGLKYR